MDVTAHRFQRSIAGQVLVVTELTALAAAPTTAMSGDPYYGAHTGNCGVLVKKQATDPRPATWDTMTFPFGPNVADHSSCRVSILMRWYYPTKSRVDGSALDVFHWYRVASPSIGGYTTEGDCSADDS